MSEDYFNFNDRKTRKTPCLPQKAVASPPDRLEPTQPVEVIEHGRADTATVKAIEQGLLEKNRR